MQNIDSIFCSCPPGNICEALLSLTWYYKNCKLFLNVQLWKHNVDDAFCDLSIHSIIPPREGDGYAPIVEDHR